MLERFFFNNTILLGFLLSVLIFLFVGLNFQLKAACRGEGFMGISSKDPIMSWVDLTFSPVYTSASTSGTSGCKNWDFPYQRYIEYVIRKFIKNSHKQLLVETVQGHGKHVKALSMMTCPQSSSEMFNVMLKDHREQTIKIFRSSKQTPKFINQLRKWIKDSPELRKTCWLS